jgi:hypothetical protein
MATGSLGVIPNIWTELFLELFIFNVVYYKC